MTISKLQLWDKADFQIRQYKIRNYSYYSFPILPVKSDSHSRWARCTYAHSLEELHPASPDLPRVEVKETNALAEQQMLGFSDRFSRRCKDVSIQMVYDGVKNNQTHK
jgi:hypothetical protein